MESKAERPGNFRIILLNVFILFWNEQLGRDLRAESIRDRLEQPHTFGMRIFARPRLKPHCLNLVEWRQERQPSCMYLEKFIGTQGQFCLFLDPLRPPC